MKGFLLSITFLIIVSFAMIPVFAQTTWDIHIPTGAADPNANYFWSVTQTGNTDGDITIPPLDIIRWQNGDTAAHTVTSGNVNDGPDSLFDSGLFGPGKEFQYQFMDEGEYEYFCIVHPWMDGVITVKAGTEDVVHILKGVGKDVDEAGKGVDITYAVDRKAVNAVVNQEQKTITFTLAGVGDKGDFKVVLPEKLITSPSAVWVDGVQVTSFQTEPTSDGIRMSIPIEANSEEIVIIGSSVIPEFGALAAIVFAIAIVSVIAIGARTQKFAISRL